MTKKASKNKVKVQPKFKLNELLFSKTNDEKQIIISKIHERGVTSATLNRIRTVKSNEKYSPALDAMQAIADVMNLKIDNLLN